ncbi:YciI family protein [Streptomyces sp. CA-106131]|uniref:YciI family protein n=1 Tax=Streptomyces sp. CA-106131 TaxID=3240045 RepID=UPI003D8AD055
MAQYAILIFDNAAAGDYTLDQQAASKRHADDLIDSGAIITAYALQSADTATSLRGDVVTDGPFIDSKEVIAGVCIIEAPDLDAALELARRNPAVQWGRGGVEVRPVAGGITPMARCQLRRTQDRRSPTRTGASGPSCSPRQCASPATWTWPRSVYRRRTPRRCRPGNATGSRATPRRG